MVCEVLAAQLCLREIQSEISELKTIINSPSHAED